jgi:hypothetical protein
MMRGPKLTLRLQERKERNNMKMIQELKMIVVAAVLASGTLALPAARAQDTMPAMATTNFSGTYVLSFSNTLAMAPIPPGVTLMSLKMRVDGGTVGLTNAVVNITNSTSIVANTNNQTTVAYFTSSDGWRDIITPPLTITSNALPQVFAIGASNATSAATNTYLAFGRYGVGAETTNGLPAVGGPFH